MSLNLKQKSFVFVAVSVTALLSMYVGFGEYNLNRNEARIEKEKHDRANGIARQVDEFIDHGLDKLQTVAELPGLVYGLQAWETDRNGRQLPFWTTLHYLFFRSDIFTSGVYLLNEQGKVLWSEPPNLDLIDTNYLPRRKIQQAEPSEGEDYTVTVWRTSKKEEILLALSLKDRDDRTIGYLVGAIPTTHPHLLSLFSIEPDEEVARLLDSSGAEVLGFPQQNRPGPAFSNLLNAATPPVFTYRSDTGPDRLVAQSRLTRAPLTVVLDQDLDIAMAGVRSLRVTMGAFGVLLALVSVGTLIFTVRSFTRPVEELTRDARRMAAGDLSGTFTLKRKDEIGILSTVLNEMKAKLKSSYEALLASERSHVMSKVVAGIAHELNNPLTVVVGQIQLLMMQDMDEVLREKLGRIQDAAKRSSKIVRNLLTFSRQRKPEWERTEINSVIKKTLDLRLYELQVGNIVATTELDSALPWTMADAHQIQQVILNLIVNAEQAMTETHGKGHLHVRTFAEDGNIHILVTDDGPGIPEKERKKVFDPFFTTKPAGKGTGLGLSICQGIIAEHGGRIDLVTSGQGTRFDVVVPVDQQTQAAPETMEVAAKVVPIRKKNILLVDDEPHIRELAKDLFEPGDYTVKTAENGKTALEMIRQEDFDLIITDLMMPEVGGHQVYTAIQELPGQKPRKVLFMTGDLMNPETQHFLENCGVPWVGKPFDISSFKQKVQSVLAA